MGSADPARLARENAKLAEQLAQERAEGLAERHGLPPALGALLATIPPDQQRARAEALAQELAEKFGSGGGNHPEAPGDPAPQEPENRVALAAVTTGGPTGGRTPAGPKHPHDEIAEEVAKADDWDQLAQAQQRLGGALGG